MRSDSTKEETHMRWMKLSGRDRYHITKKGRQQYMIIIEDAQVE